MLKAIYQNKNLKNIEIRSTTPNPVTYILEISPTTKRKEKKRGYKAYYVPRQRT